MNQLAEASSSAILACTRRSGCTPRRGNVVLQLKNVIGLSKGSFTSRSRPPVNAASVKSYVLAAKRCTLSVCLSFGGCLGTTPAGMDDALCGHED
jgi:hypothetical protein